jgi:glycosyltransferase involved in cell wall biosynthesis
MELLIDRSGQMPRVCLVTEELAGVGGSGGIGAAFRELAVMLASRGVEVDVMYCPVAPLGVEERRKLEEDLFDEGVKLLMLDEQQYVEGPASYEKRSYAVYRELERLPSYDFIHFHDYKGLGFASINARRQGAAFARTQMVVQLHGPTRWTIEANGGFFVHEDQLKIDYMERKSIEGADHVVSPSAYLVDWLERHGYALPPSDRVHVIKNVCSGLLREVGRFRRSITSDGPFTDLVLFARHEDRKGFAVFCDALDRLDKLLARRNVTVTFMGKLGMVNCQPSGVFLADRSRDWTFKYRIRSGFDRVAASTYIAACERPLVVVPSPHENSPYTVLETVALGVPLISSADGGGAELIAEGYPGVTEIGVDALVGAIERALDDGLAAPTPRESLESIEDAWLAFHRQPAAARPQPTTQPRVALAITHHERPAKLVDALMSVARQSYENLDVIVVDDGSARPETVQALDELEVMLRRMGGRLIRRQNGYLGAARNTALQATEAEYICFLDDDDYAFPKLIETLVRAAESTGADVVNCLNVYMPESHRYQMIPRAAEGGFKVGYVPIGGPLSIASTENTLGAATALIRTSALREVGGYTELKGVGHEDYELFLRMLQAGKRIEIVPQPLYFYEVGRPSMLSRTSMTANFRRCFDAIDLGDTRESRDLLSLTLGKKVAVDGHNRQWWIYSQSPTAALRHRVMADCRTREETLQALLQLARAEGNMPMVLALMEDLQSTSKADAPAEDADLVSLEPVAVGRPATTPAFDARLAGVKVDLALGRHDSAMDGLVRHLESAKRLDAESLGLARQLVQSGRAALDRYQQLAATLVGIRIPRALFDELIVLQAGVERLAAVDGCTRALSEVVASDESRYVALHPDVSQAVEDGRFRRGVEHYLMFGYSEGRPGFALTTQVVELACAGGVQTAVEDLLELACQNAA